MSGQQFFSEKEVGEIVKRASELQETAPADGAGYVPGVSREELTNVAKEMGIDAAYLDKALQERMNKGPTRGLTFLGVPLTRDFERVVPGELPPEDFDVVMDEIGPRRRTQFTSQVGRSLQSRVHAGIGLARMLVNSRDGRTRIRMKSLAIFPFLLTMYPILILSSILSSQIARFGAGSWIPPAVFAGVLAIGWTAFAFLAKQGHKAVQELGDRIEARIAEVTHHQGGPPVTSADDELKAIETKA